jgi:hypothetical protein
LTDVEYGDRQRIILVCEVQISSEAKDGGIGERVFVDICNIESVKLELDMMLVWLHWKK